MVRISQLFVAGEHTLSQLEVLFFFAVEDKNLKDLVSV